MNQKESKQFPLSTKVVKSGIFEFKKKQKEIPKISLNPNEFKEALNYTSVGEYKLGSMLG